MGTGLLTLSTFAAVTLVVLGISSLVFDLFVRDRSRMARRLEDEFRDTLRVRVKHSSLFRYMNDSSHDGSESVPDLRSRLEIMIEQSGMEVSLNKLFGVSAGLAVAGFVACLPVVPHWWLSFAGAIAGSALPFMYVQLERKRRLLRLRDQLPEAFELMSRAVRAGQTLNAALLLVAQEGKPPISDEFAYCCEQQNLGLPHDVTLLDLAHRNGLMELRMFVVALLIQRQTGGNPVELLNNLSDVIRKRVRLNGKVRALTGEGRMQAMVLSILPLVALAAIYVLNPSYAKVLLDRPVLLVVMLVSQAVGALWIRKIVNFDY